MCSTFESSLGHRTPALNGELFNPTEWFKMEKKMEIPSEPQTGKPAEGGLYPLPEKRHGARHTQPRRNQG